MGSEARLPRCESLLFHLLAVPLSKLLNFSVPQFPNWNSIYFKGCWEDWVNVYGVPSIGKHSKMLPVTNIYQRTVMTLKGQYSVEEATTGTNTPRLKWLQQFLCLHSFGVCGIITKSDPPVSSSLGGLLSSKEVMKLSSQGQISDSRLSLELKLWQ